MRTSAAQHWLGGTTGDYAKHALRLLGAHME
jgi:hypothetical protein